MKAGKEIRLKGISLSKGIAYGKVSLLSKQKNVQKELRVQKKEVDQEIHRYREALSRSRKDLQELQRSCAHEQAICSQEVLQAHIEILSDPSIVGMVEKKIRFSQQKTEAAFVNVMEEYQHRFHEIKDPYFQERIQDVADVSRRVLKNLVVHGKKRNAEPAIVLAEEIFPSDTVAQEGCDILAFVTFRGGYNSHAAIIARSRGIPYVSEIDLSKIHNLQIEAVLVDATHAEVIFNPSKKTVKLYEKKIQTLHEEKKKNRSVDLPFETADGHKVDCYVNIDVSCDMDPILQHPIAGIGIFRTEFLILTEKGIPSCDRQIQIYQDLARKLFPLPLVIRLFDFGDDKTDLFSPKAKRLFDQKLDRATPSISRGIRFLLQQPKILEDQLFAILSASEVGNVHLLLPFVSDVAEILEVKRRIKDIKKSHFSESRAKISLGSMIEVPAAALMVDSIAKEVDFLSIGTNDLTHYLLAQDRSHMSSLPKKIPPSLLRLLQIIVQAIDQEKTRLFLCGEMASHREYLPVFLGMGIRRFSMSLSHLDVFKETIRSLNLKEIQKKTKEDRRVL